MIKYFSTTLITASLSLGLSGCGTLNIPKPTQTITSSQKVFVEQVYTFNDSIDNSSINRQEIMKAVAETMSNKSSYPDKKNKWNGTYYDIKGRTIESSDNSIKITYVNGDNNCHSCVNRESVSKVQFILPSSIVQNNQNTYAFKCNMPTSFSITPHTNAIGMEHPLLGNPAHLENDVAKMLNALNNAPLTITKTFSFKGEINTKYPDKSIFANFKRILGQYRWGSQENLTEIKKQNTFSFNVNGQDYPLYIEVFPYRDGSKVVYSSNLSYSIDSKGGSTLTKNNIQALHKRIEKITND